MYVWGGVNSAVAFLVLFVGSSTFLGDVMSQIVDLILEEFALGFSLRLCSLKQSDTMHRHCKCSSSVFKKTIMSSK